MKLLQTLAVTLAVLTFCTAALAEEAVAEKAPAKVYFGAKANIIMLGKTDVNVDYTKVSDGVDTASLTGVAPDFDPSITAGFNIFLEYALLPWLAVGGQFGYQALHPTEESLDELITYYQFDPTVRFFWTAAPWAEPYIKLVPGFLIGRRKFTDTGFGWNAQVLAGTIFKVGPTVGLSVEVGGQFSGFKSSQTFDLPGGKQAVADYMFLDRFLLVNIGVTGIL